MKSSWKIGVVIASVLGLAGCRSDGSSGAAASTDPTDQDEVRASAVPAEHDAAATEQTPELSAEPHDAEQNPDPGAAGDAITVAVQALAAFCRPTLEQKAWIDELSPFLTQQAAVAYETVDPVNVPCTSLTGDARVRDGDGTFTLRVLIPTDAGEYSVYVHRPTDATPWGVEQITPRASE